MVKESNPKKNTLDLSDRPLDTDIQIAFYYYKKIILVLTQANAREFKNIFCSNLGK